MLNIPWSLLLIWFMIRLILEKNTPVGKSECKIFIKKLKTHNLAMDLLKKIQTFLSLENSPKLSPIWR